MWHWSMQVIASEIASFDQVPGVQAELLEALEEEHKQQENRKASKKKKKSALKSSDKADSTDSSLTEMSCVTVVSGSAAHPACSKCAILQGPQRPGKKGRTCSNCLDCKAAAGKLAKLSSLSSRASSESAPKAVSSPRTQSAFLSSSLQRMSSSSSSSDQFAGSNSTHSSGSKSPVEPGTPSSLSSQRTDDGWEVQQRSKRVAPAEKQGSDGFSVTSQPRACRTAPALHPALAATWQPAPENSPSVQKPLMRDMLAHHVHGSPGSTEVLHLASGPVSFHPPPPPPPPRIRAANTDNGVPKAQHGSTAGNAWNVPGKAVGSASGAGRTAWGSAVHQVHKHLHCHHAIVVAQVYQGSFPHMHC